MKSIAASGTYMGVPHGEAAKTGQACILGIPFDCGTHPTRIGARQGPRAIREHSGLVRPFYPALSDTNVLEELAVIDLGDVQLTSGQVDSALPAIDGAIDQIVAAGAYPVAMGGDGIVSLPQMRAASRTHGDLVVVHIDAHTDAYDLPGYNTSTTFTRAAEERVVDVERSFHIGARGTLAVRGAYAHTRGLGYRVILGDEVRKRGILEVAHEVRDAVGASPVYLCFDMDYFDPSCAPGVATPTWGGPDAASALDLLHGLAGLRIIAVDVNTVSPAHDVGGMTACLAAHVMLAGLHLIALGRRASR